MFEKLFQRLKPALSFTQKHAGIVMLGGFILAIIGLALARNSLLTQTFQNSFPKPIPACKYWRNGREIQPVNNPIH